MTVTKDQIRQIIAENNLNSVADVYSLLRDSFKDMKLYKDLLTGCLQFLR